MRKIYMTQYILIGLSVLSASLSGMENHIISTNDNTQATAIIKTLQTSCDLIKDRTLSNGAIDAAKNSFNRKLRKIDEKIIPTVIAIIDNDDTLKHKTILQESLKSELLKKQKDHEITLQLENEKIKREKLKVNEIKKETLKTETIKSEKSENEKVETQSTYQKWFFAAGLTVCLACLLLLLSKKSHLQRYFTPTYLH